MGVRCGGLFDDRQSAFLVGCLLWTPEVEMLITDQGSRTVTRPRRDKQRDPAAHFRLAQISDWCALVGCGVYTLLNVIPRVL